MKESDLAKPVMEWLASRGFTPYGEVPWYNRAIDVVGLSECEVEAVELKRSLTRHVIYQATLNQLTAHRSWCAVATRPRNFEKRLREGIGLIVVSDGCAEVLLEATLRPTILQERRLRQIRGACAYKTPNGEAGLPTMRGIGPAQSVYDAVESYRVENPHATWQQIFEAIPNHYCHYKSLRGAMRVVAERRAWQLRRTEGAA